MAAGEEISLTGRRARAMHRGQCSSASQWALGAMLKPQRGQFKSSGRWALDDGLPGFITTARLMELWRFRWANRSRRPGADVLSS